MKRTAILLAVTLFGSLIASAQSPDSGVFTRPAPQMDGARRFVYNFDGARPVVLAEAVHDGCPVSMRARLKSNAGVMNARNGPSRGLAQLVHLTVGGATYSSGILSVKVTVYGTTAKARWLPVIDSDHDLSDAKMTFDLHGNAWNADEVSSDLTLRGFTSVQSVALESVMYADGTHWSTTGGRSCSVAPDPVMLVEN